MRYRLRSYELSPPGAYPFVDSDGRSFPAQPMIEAQAQIVSNYRKANGKPRSSVKEALSDIDCYTCQRLGNMPQFCVPSDSANVVALAANAPVIAPPCQGCGAPVGQ